MCFFATPLSSSLRCNWLYKNGQPIGVTEHSHYFENLESLLQRYLDEGCVAFFLNTLYLSRIQLTFFTIIPLQTKLWIEEMGGGEIVFERTMFQAHWLLSYTFTISYSSFSLYNRFFLSIEVLARQKWQNIALLPCNYQYTHHFRTFPKRINMFLSVCIYLLDMPSSQFHIFFLSQLQRSKTYFTSFGKVCHIRCFYICPLTTLSNCINNNQQLQIKSLVHWVMYYHYHQWKS